MNKTKICGIYKITSPSGKSYIGQGNNIIKRWKHHKARYMIDVKKHPKLYNSLRKYGVSNHEFKIIEECDSLMLNDREIYFVSFYNSCEEGLNCTFGGFGTRGYKHSEEQRKNNSRAQKEKPNFDEWREKLSKAHKGQLAWNKGLKCGKQSEETIEKRRKSITGTKKTQEDRNNIRLRQLGKVLTDAHKAKLSQSHLGQKAWNKGIPQSEETRKKNSDAQKIAWARKKSLLNKI